MKAWAINEGALSQVQDIVRPPVNRLDLKDGRDVPFNNFNPRWFPCGNIHWYRVVLVGNSNAVCFCRRQILLGIFQI